MEVEGDTLLFYDKYSDSHAFNNPITCKVTIESLLTSNMILKTNQDAIKEYNLFGGTHTLPKDLEKKIYRVMMYINGKEKYTLIAVNNNQIKKYVESGKDIPNFEFFKNLCHYHLCYNKSMMANKSFSLTLNTNLVEINSNDIIDTAKKTVGDIVDEMIDVPEFLTLKLHDYQKRSIKWMLKREEECKSINFNINDEVKIGEVHYDLTQQKVVKNDDRKKLIFSGGALIDEVGLGKTIQISTMSLLNPRKETYYTRIDSKRLFSRATLVLCPNQLCGQWTRELKSKIKTEYGLTIIPMLTKVHFDKYTYQDLLDADFVIVSYTFLENKVFLDSWITAAILGNKTFLKTPPTKEKIDSANAEFDKIGSSIINNLDKLSNTGVVLPVITWHRIIVDEFHELYTIMKYTHVTNILPLLRGKYRWCLTGTPFDKGSMCLYKMLDYVTGYTNTYGERVIMNEYIVNHMKTNFFRRNTKESILSEYKLPPINNKTIRLKFSSTECMMYNAYLANENNDKYSIFLRQLCCYPKLADEIKVALTNCKTLEDIEKVMVKHNETMMNNALEKLNNAKKSLKKLELTIKIYTYKRQQRMLKKKGYIATIEGLEDIEQEKKKVDVVEDEEINIELEKEKEEDDDEESNRPKIVISDDNQDEIMKILKDVWNKDRITLNNMQDAKENSENRVKLMAKEYEGKRTTYEFFNNVIEKIKKTADKKKKPDDSDKDSDEDSDEEDDEETCGICLGEIPENDIGVTKCGHMFCYQCVKGFVATKHECPYCRKSVKSDELYMISYEKNNKVEDSKEIKDKIALINVVGTKLANLIYYLKHNNEHTIIFSQWDDLLHKVGDVLTTHGIKNTYCRGSVWQRDKAIRTFNEDDSVKVIMLSSESAASGTNLTKAKQVILLDPVYGTYEYRKNTEWQAIGRAHRMGQTREVDVVRFVIKNTIEEEILEMNLEEDKKHTTTLTSKSFESTDDNIVLSEEKVKEIDADVKNNEKKAKAKKEVKKMKKEDVAKKIARANRI